MFSYPNNWIHKEPTPNPARVNVDGGARADRAVSAVANSGISLGLFSCVNPKSSISDSSGQSWAERNTHD